MAQQDGNERSVEEASMTITTTRSINIRTEIPGPRSREIVARREASVPSGLYKAHQIAVERAAGALVTDVDGNTFIDFIGGIGVLNAGHCPPEVVAAIQAQATKLLHFSALVGTYEPYVELAERLNAAVPIDGPCKTILSNSGAEGVENAIKIARAATGRQAIVAFEGGYHGRTLMTLSLTSKTSFKKTFGPFAPEIYRAPFPYAYRMGLSEAAAVEQCWEAFERMLVAGVGPDILVSAKSIAAGLPLAATTGRAEIMDKAHIGGIGGTYGGNPLACVAAIEVLNAFQDGDLLKRAGQVGQAVCERATAWKDRFPLIGDVRGMGAMIAIELVKDRSSRAPAADEVLAVVTHCAEHGLLTMRAGLYANCLRLLMPLTITDDQLQEGLDVLEDGLRAVGDK